MSNLELDAALPKSISVSATLFNYIYTELSIKSLDYIYYHFTDNSYGLEIFLISYLKVISAMTIQF